MAADEPAVDSPFTALRSSSLSRRAILSAFAAAIVLGACGKKPNDTCGQGCRNRSPQPSPSQSPAVAAFNRALTRFETSPVAADDANNEAGQLAWGQSYALLGLMRVYEATRQPEYLEKVAQVGEQILAQTDQARGVVDYQGRSGPVWRAGATYTASVAKLDSSSGIPVIEARYAGTSSDLASVTVIPGSTPVSFTLLLRHPHATTIRLADLSTNPEDTRFAEKVVLDEAYRTESPWTVSVISSGLPRSGTTPLQAQYNVYAVCTGMITYPLGIYARTVLEDRDLASGAHRRRAEQFLLACREAVAFHDFEWSESSDGRSGYVFPKGAPVSGDGNHIPFNQSNAMGQTLAELYRITGDQEYANKVRRLASAWRASLARYSGGGFVWSYWPPFSKVYTGYTSSDQVSVYTPDMSPMHQLEDLSHGAITAEFATAAYNAGIGVSGHDLTILGQTYLDQLRRGPEYVRMRFGGRTATHSEALQALRWLGLGNKGVARHAATVAGNLRSTATSGSGVLALGYLAWAHSRGLV